MALPQRPMHLFNLTASLPPSLLYLSLNLHPKCERSCVERRGYARGPHNWQRNRVLLGKNRAKRNSLEEEEEWGEFTRFVNFDGNLRRLLRPPGSPSSPPLQRSLPANSKVMKIEGWNDARLLSSEISLSRTWRPTTGILDDDQRV